MYIWQNTGWALLADPILTICVDAPIVLGEAVIAMLMRTQGKKVDLKRYMSKEIEAEWLHRNFTLKSFKALHKNSICGIGLYKDEFVVSPLKLDKDERGRDIGRKIEMYKQKSTEGQGRIKFRNARWGLFRTLHLNLQTICTCWSTL